MSCVFCGEFKFHICGSCVQKLLYASEDAIREGIQLAIEKGYTEKAKALEKFTGIGGENGRETGTNINRTGTRRAVQRQKRTDRLSTQTRKAAIRSRKQ